MSIISQSSKEILVCFFHRRFWNGRDSLGNLTKKNKKSVVNADEYSLKR